MTDEELARRKKLTFAQAEGLEGLPPQLKHKEISSELSAIVWAILHEHMHACCASNWDGLTLQSPWLHIMRDHFVLVNHKPVDEFDQKFYAQAALAKHVCYSKRYHQFYGFIQYILRHPYCPEALSEEFNLALKRSRAPYRVMDGDTIVPFATPEEGAAVAQALQALGETDMKGAKAHLKAAATACSEGKFADSVRESIHAVESVARMLAPGSKGLGVALAKLEKSQSIHGALRSGFGQLYGYTSEEGGIRHPMLEKDAPQVDETDALFMLGACASFVTYLTNRARQSNLLDSE